MMNFRIQYDPRFEIMKKSYPPSEVQPNMCPSISQMVKTRSVGGSLLEYEQDGIQSDAPFESEYLDFFDMDDMLRDQESAAAERKAAENDSPNGEAPPKTDNQPDQPSGESGESEK